MKSYAVDHGLPCLNPNCKSGGRPHYGCLCYGGGGEGDFNRGRGLLAHGGMVCDCHLAHGGEAEPHATLGHASVHHGLLGLLKDVGNAKLAEPQKHHKTMDKVKSHLAMDDHEKASKVLHGHPLAGGAGKEAIEGMLPTMSQGLQGNDSDPEAMRGSMDYLHSAVKGHKTLESGIGGMLGKEKLGIEPEKGSADSLKSYLDEVRENPSKLLEVGGKLGHYLPNHGAHLGALAATATDYLNTLKPAEPQGGPMDEPMPPNKMAMANYTRQVDIAQKPTLVLQHVKDGTLIPQDLKTIQTIYPGLYKSITDKVGEALVEAKTKKKEIPYKQRMSLSLLLGQPLDFSQTPQAMQAIMQGNSLPGSNQPQPQGKSGATEGALKQINKVDDLDKTTLEARQINRNKS